MGIIGYLVVTALTVVPLWRILPRAGLAKQWALAAALPLGAVVLLWVLAYRRWPMDEPRADF
jgi:hypothetical protein